MAVCLELMSKPFNAHADRLLKQRRVLGLQASKEEAMLSQHCVVKTCAQNCALVQTPHGAFPVHHVSGENGKSKFSNKQEDDHILLYKQLH